MKVQMDEYRRYMLILSAAMFIACIAYLIVVFALDLSTEVMEDRYWKNVQPLINGESFDMEYPPFALVFMLIPRLFGWDPFPYNVAYVMEVFVFMVIGLYYTDKLAQHFGKSRKGAMLVYTVLMILLLEFVLDRFDIFPAVLSLMSVYYFVKKKYPIAFIILSIAVLTKLYPALLGPIFVFQLMAEKDWKNVWKNIVIFCIATVVLLIPFILIDSNCLSYFLGYHSDRPLQIESVAASFVYIFSMFGLIETKITSAEDPGSFGSDNLVGAVPDAIAGILMPLMVVCVVAVCLVFLWMYNKVAKEDRFKLLAYACAAVTLVFIIVGKVFSAQYLIWVIPFIVMIVMMKERMMKNDLFKMTVLAFVFTQIEFVYNIGILHGGSNINDAGMMIILIRNLMVIAMLWFVLRDMRALLPEKSVSE